MRVKKAIAGILAVCICISCIPSARAGEMLPLSQPDVWAKGAVVMEAETGRLLYAHDGGLVTPMASTTKIMTTLVVLEQAVGRLDSPFVVNADAVKAEGSSMGLRVGDTVTLRALCYGMMLPSGNDAANVAAVKVGGSIEGFTALMNQKAAELGMEQTHFVTPSGLDAEAHHSTAYDMALLMRAAMQNPEFVAITGTESIRLSYGNPPYERTLSNHNRLLGDDGIIGGKTGFTDDAGRCLVTVAHREGITLICVTLDCSDDWNAHRNLYDLCFPLLELVDVGAVLDTLRLPVVGGVGDIHPVANHSMMLPLTPQEIEMLDIQVLCQPLIYAPVSEGALVGEMVCSFQDRVIWRCELLSATDIPLSFEPVSSKNLFERLWDFITGA